MDEPGLNAEGGGRTARLDAEQGLQIVAAVLLLEVLQRQLKQYPEYGGQTVYAVGLFRLLQVAVMLAMVRRLFRRPWEAAGLSGRPRALRDLAVGALAALAAGGGLLAYRAVVAAQGGGDLFDRLGLRVVPIGDIHSPLWANALVMGLVGPVAEDLFFWGILYGLIRPKAGALGAFLAVGIPYVLLHWQGSWMALVEPSIGGACFWLLFEWRRSVFATIPLHAAGNLGILLVNRRILFGG